MKLKKNDLVRHESGAIVTVLKTYTNENKEKFVQVFNENGFLFDRLESFRPVDCMLLRCNNCEKESYETNLSVNEKGLYECKCGSSTFTPLNIDLDEINNY